MVLPHAGGLNGDAVQHRIGPRKVNVLKDAMAAGFGAATLPAGGDPVGAEDDHLARLDVPLEGGADGRQRATLGGDDVGAVGHPAKAKGTEAVRVAQADELLRRHQHQRIGALQPLNGAGDGLLNGGGGQPLLGDQVGDDLGIAGRMEDGAGQFQFVAKLSGVGQVAVVGQGQLALLVVDLDGPAVAPAGGAGGGVAGVGDHHLPLREGGQHLFGKDLVDQAQVLVGSEDAVVIHDDAATLLAPVLEGEEAVVGQVGHVGGRRRHHAEDAAFLMDAHAFSFWLWAKAAPMKPLKSGWGLLGRDLNSG